MEFQYNDGGRERAGFKGQTGDCAVRAIVIATGMDYQKVYDEINGFGKLEKITKRKKGKSNARLGVYRVTMHDFMKKIGWKWTPTMLFGQGCKVHVKKEELPSGNLILNLSKHYAACINGVVHDIFDPSRDETRCVYGYWSK